jgi:hypothetical protein
MIEYAKTTDINLMFLQGMTTPWGQELKDNGKMGGKPLKTRVRKGWKQIEEQVNINVEHVMRKNDDGEMEFFLNVGKARGYGGRAVQNTEIPYVEFPEFATAVFPDTEQEDWL